MKILITGCAGFIGFHLCMKFLQQKFEIIGLDNLDKYYDYDLKKNRMKILRNQKHFKFYKIDINSKKKMENMFRNEKIKNVIHLAAQAGVRDSINKPELFIDSNISGFSNIIDLSAKNRVDKFIYASSSSVYGLNESKPSSESENCDKPASLYGATKKSNELIAHTYSHIFKLNTIGLRFFTVYGPWGRPDMALFKFTKAIFTGRTIEVYNYGRMKRDFTFIDDVTDAVYRIFTDFQMSKNNYEIFNIGSGQQVSLNKFINLLEKIIGKKANKKLLPMQKGDVKNTSSMNNKIINSYKYKVNYKLQEGLKKFVDWYKTYYKI